MAISRVSAQDAAAAASAQTITATYPGTPTQGNLLLACCYSATGLFTLTMSSTGWTVAGAALESTNGPNSLNIFYKIAGASESTTVQCAQSSGSNAVMRLQIYEYTATGWAQDGSAPSIAGSSSTITSLASNSIATTSANDLLFCGISWNAATSARSFDNSFTALTQTTRMVTANRIVASTSTYSTTCSWSTNSTSTCHLMVAFSEVASATGHTSLALTGVG
jgi:hypothetical protein